MERPYTERCFRKTDWGVHAIGEVWAQILFVMTETLEDKHGYSATLFPPTDPADWKSYYTHKPEFNDRGELAKPLVPKAGNTLAVQLVINGFVLFSLHQMGKKRRVANVEGDSIGR